MHDNVTVTFPPIAEDPDDPRKTPEQILADKEKRELIGALVKCDAFDAYFLTTAILEYYDRYGRFA